MTMITDSQMEAQPPSAADEPMFGQPVMRVDAAVTALAGLDGPARVIADEFKSAVEAGHVRIRVRIRVGS